jgi:hypothetical protein
VLECGNMLGGGCGVFLRFIINEVGDRSKIRFWHDV